MNKTMTARQRLARLFFILLPASFILSVTGCTILGALVSKVAPQQTIPAQYTSFQDQSIAIMVWADDGTMIDFPAVRADVAGSLQVKLQQAATQGKVKHLAGISFPTSPATVVRFQDDHADYQTTALADVAPSLGASRVIYVELERLQTRSDASVELYRGSAAATLKVVEVPADGGPAKVAYEETEVTAVFPPNAREEGSPFGNDFAIYRGTVDALTSELAKRFVPHMEDQ